MALFDSLDQTGYWRLLRSLQGTGAYSDDDTANVNREWNGVAKIAALVSTVLEAAGKNMFWSQADELLSDLERMLGMPSDEGLTTAQRQSRLKAFARALPKMVEARLDAAFDGYLGATSGATTRTSSASAINAAAAPFGGLYTHRRESSADSVERRTLNTILSRGLPARSLGGKVSTGDATFGTGAIDGLSISTTAAVTPASQTKSRAAVFDYFPGSVIDVNDWIEIQSMLLWKSRGLTISQSAQGRTIVVSGSIDASAAVTLDGPTLGGATAINWSNRFTQAWGFVSTSDIRPGGSAEDLTADSGSVWLPPSKLGNATAAYQHDIVYTTISSPAALALTVNSSGDLRLVNKNATAYYFVLMIRCTPQHTENANTDTQPWVSQVDITNAALTDIYRSTAIRDADGGGAGWTKTALFGGDQGAIRRILYTGPLGKATATGSINHVVLDSSEDWRKRYVAVSAVYATSSTGYITAFSRAAPTVTAGTDSRTRLFYTGTGATIGSATAQPYQQKDPSDNIWIFADSATGNLVAEMKSTDSADDYATACFMLTASEMQDGSSTVTAVPLHATQVHALDLNQPQNNGCFAQGLQGGAPRNYAFSPAPGTAPTNPPLGLIAEGTGGWRRPVQHYVRERVGRVDDSTWLCRQKLFNQRKRIVSIDLATGTDVAIDVFNDPTGVYPGGAVDQIDFRDRLIVIEGRMSSTNITIYNGGAGRNSDVNEPSFAFTFYTGPHSNLTATDGTLTATFEFSRSGTSRGYHSRLILRQDSGVTKYVNMTVDLSGYLGLTDRRLYGATT